MPPGTALLVVDMQNDLVRPGRVLTVDGADATIPRLVALLETFRREGLPLMHACRVYRTDGADVEKVRQKAFFESGGFLVEGSEGSAIVPELTPWPGEPLFARPGWSAFQSADLRSAITASATRRLVLAGADLPNSLRLTAYDALSLNLDVTVVRDGTASPRSDVHEGNLGDLARAGVRVDTCLEVIREATAGLLARP
ncbi:MAG TPA: isochorismatase family cysteine hydrolase [Dehalococcoidia bacterium]|nr:isochorismatase family cysteine hydrolase [Dehalococcoidia bacterium]